jgi:hypothetical protein
MICLSWRILRFRPESARLLIILSGWQAPFPDSGPEVAWRYQPGHGFWGEPGRTKSVFRILPRHGPSSSSGDIGIVSDPSHRIRLLADDHSLWTDPDIVPGWRNRERPNSFQFCRIFDQFVLFIIEGKTRGSSLPRDTGRFIRYIAQARRNS